MVETIIRCCLAKVALDGRDTLLQQARDLLLIPADGLGVREVEYRILVGHATRGVRHVQALLDDLWEETVLRGEVRQLPQTGVEAVLRQLLQHLHRILETVLRKLIVTLPVHAEPARIKMDHIRGDLMSPQLFGNLQALLLREVGDTAHPRAEAPERHHRTLSRDVGIFVEDILRLSEEHEKVHLLVGHKQALGSDIRGTEVAGDGGRGVHKDAIATIGEIERHGLVLAVALWSLRVSDTQMNLLPYFI